MNYSLPGGGTLFMGATAQESLLDKIVARIKSAARWLKDTLNQKGVP